MLFFVLFICRTISQSVYTTISLLVCCLIALCEKRSTLSSAAHQHQLSIAVSRRLTMADFAADFGDLPLLSASILPSTKGPTVRPSSLVASAHSNGYHPIHRISR